MIRDLALANVAEMEAGKLARDRVEVQVRRFGDAMIQDHTRALGELQTRANRKGVDLPSEPTLKYKTMAPGLRTLSGSKFDNYYVSMVGVNDMATPTRCSHELNRRTQTPIFALMQPEPCRWCMPTG